ncbi:hypothetical protein RFI_01059 [Reticulomyxa filosa]|uniref:Kelch motif family protein n=1 Tax=Reticulomyxa filosa TaxID=46433 RepID=X6PE94_RETFI|nr:hypothetical protein RFI_01059 [Reticulomyxa filosa]|eukprot:ETO36002.1 hypothetical protein RFI_01059 [Reticulomyxa filosa]
MSNQTFQILKELPTPLYRSQGVLHKHEFLICGGRDEKACYSYHTLKNEYKFICEYPSHVKLDGHCVVKLVDNNKDSDQITLLSFGGECKHTLVMKYVSVWSNTLDISKKSNKINNYNQWIPFTNNHNHPIIIGRDNDNYLGVRAVIGGSNNHLLFIICYPRNISIFDLNAFQFIKHDTLPANFIRGHCFVSKSENEQGQEMMKKNKQNYEMLLFCRKTGLSIEYDENNNNFQFHQLPVCKDIAPFNGYAYVYINDVILFFGGCNWICSVISTSVHKYSIREKKWITFKNVLPIPLCDCFVTLNNDNNYIYIIGGYNDGDVISTNMKMRLSELICHIQVSFLL